MTNFVPHCLHTKINKPHAVVPWLPQLFYPAYRETSLVCLMGDSGICGQTGGYRPGQKDSLVTVSLQRGGRFGATINDFSVYRYLNKKLRYREDI